MDPSTRRAFVKGGAVGLGASLTANVVADGIPGLPDSPQDLNPFNPGPGGLGPNPIAIPNFDWDQFAKDLIEKLLGKLSDLAKGVPEAAKALGAITDYDAVDLSKVASGLKEGPLKALGLLQDFGELQRSFEHDQAILDRLRAVEDSLVDLVDMQFPGDNEPLLKKPIAGIVDLLEAVLKGPSNGGKTPSDALVDFLVDLLDPSPIIGNILGSVTQHQLWQNWLEFPSGLATGQLHEWLNATSAESLADEKRQRDYRYRLAGEFDKYFRRLTPDEFSVSAASDTPLADVDRQASTTLVCELITLFLDTTVKYVFDSDDYPITPSHWTNPEDTGPLLAAGFARQQRSATRTAVGTTLRGFWIWSVENETLIEAIGAFAGGLFASIIEAITRNLAWFIEIRSSYDDYGLPAEYIFTEKIDQIVYRPASGEMQLHKLSVLFHVLVRNNRREQLTIPGEPFESMRDLSAIDGMMKDLVAYLVLAYRRWGIDGTDSGLIGFHSGGATLEVEHLSAFDQGTSSTEDWTRVTAAPRLAENEQSPVIWLRHPQGVTVMSPLEDGRRMAIIKGKYPADAFRVVSARSGPLPLLGSAAPAAQAGQPASPGQPTEDQRLGNCRPAGLATTNSPTVRQLRIANRINTTLRLGVVVINAGGSVKATEHVCTPDSRCTWNIRGKRECLVGAWQQSSGLLLALGTIPVRGDTDVRVYKAASGYRLGYE